MIITIKDFGKTFILNKIKANIKIKFRKKNI